MTEPRWPEGVTVTGPIMPEYQSILTPAALSFVANLQRAFNSRRLELLQRRAERQLRIDRGELPDFLPETAHLRSDRSWRVAHTTVPEGDMHGQNRCSRRHDHVFVLHPSPLTRFRPAGPAETPPENGTPENDGTAASRQAPVQPRQAGPYRRVGRQPLGTVDLKADNPRRIPISLSAAVLDNGYVVRAWETLDPGYKMIGTATLFTESLQPASAVVPYTDRWDNDLIAYNTALPFANGNVLIAYIDRRDQRGKFVLYNAQMKIIKGPVVFSPKNAHRFSAVRLPGGMSTLIAFYEPERPPSDALWDHMGGQCLFTVVNAEGAIVSPPKAFVL